jgi:hypothetical protein
MIKLTVANPDQLMRDLKHRSKKLIETITKDVLVTVKKFTPYQEGRARQGWRITRGSRGNSVVNRVPYIGKLEQGSSTQAPNGMIEPTIKEISKRRYK